MRNPARHRSPRPRVASRASIAILAAGLIAAAASGVAAHRAVGPYGDGPINVGLYRAQDPETGAQLVYRKIRTADGGELRYLFDDATRKLTEVRLKRAGQSEDVRVAGPEGLTWQFETPGQTFARDPKTGGTKSGFSLRGNGITDAWEYRDAKGRLQRIEVSRRQNGVVDRWEYYEDDQLSRVEEDENRDGRVDRWLTYDAGILVHEAQDRNGDGRPDSFGR